MRTRFPVALVLLLAVPALAQEPPQPGEGSTAPAVDSSAKRRAEFITQLLKADVRLQEGLGLKAVQLGTPFSAVVGAWGKPLRFEDGHLLGTDKWYYRADYFTEIRLDGDNNRVARMAFRGKPGSPYQTLRGAGFGMPTFQVRAIYGPGRSSRDDSLIEYPGLGVSFHFSRGVLEGIEIYPPS